MTEPSPPGALEGVRVINAGQILAAPFCATLLCEFGAEVIKVEPPERGEVSRGGIAFEQENRGHKAVTLNLKAGEGKSLFRRLCDSADILIENFRPGTLERLELSPDSLRETNPGLIAVRFSGYGQTGPYKDRAGFDRVALGFSGMTYVTGDTDRRPVRPGYMIADYGSGMFGAFGAVTALQARNHTGRGQDVDVALYESIWRMSGSHAAGYGLTGENRPRTGNYFPGVVPAEQWTTSDGHDLIINATTQRVFERLCEAIGQPELPSDPRFTPRVALQENHEAIHAIVGEWVEVRTLEDCLATLEAFGIPATKVYATSDIVADPHYAAREQVITLPTETHGELLQPGIAPRLTDTPGRVRGRAPNLGEHNREIFVDALGVDSADFERMIREGVI